MSGRAASALGLLLCWLGAAPPAGAVVNIAVINTDGPSEGLNDPTFAAPVGGNQASTRGGQRLAAVMAAASAWATRLSSVNPTPVQFTIQVEASFDPLPCSANSGVLGQGGANSMHHDFPNAPLPATFYPQALANTLAGSDLAPGTPDISVVFNTALDGSACLGSDSWYYGLDARPPGDDIDLITIALHELGHGLGITAGYDVSTGTRPNGLDDAYTHHLARLGAVPSALSSMTDAQRRSASIADPSLVWIGAQVDTVAGALSAGTNGGHARLHAPNPVVEGSSVSHFTPDAVPDQLMEPSYTGPIHDPGLALPLLCDLGWPCTVPQAVPALPRGWALALLTGLTALGATARRRRGGSGCGPDARASDGVLR